MAQRSSQSSPPSSPVTDPATEPAGTSFRSAVDVMLNRASSSIRRGPCTCLSCRGGGTISCPHCKGAGVLSAQEVERGQLLKGVVQKFRDAGRLLCELCTGSGLRYPHLAKDHWRQCAGQPGAEAGDECPIE
ncbi:hypothetical protein TSOC_001760 [Tetrabaena socialis]|uniref:Uncharacterized protein n=1 Tax=Tetrabaena socialis TaxID=47790 RepID=A0A2J8AFQ6_9CHLO|nr:hypothetical protein TSOC_001760 [Tetrabaena socialis]|eukprot:PNH11355.1 hypothetical protein TSOC_001760 [Tetrabaena socialis]